MVEGNGMIEEDARQLDTELESMRAEYPSEMAELEQRLLG